MAKPRKQKLKRADSTPSPGGRRLKLFRTPAGFHDAYVAAPSRKAALAAWGAETDLFSAGIAAEVKDAALLEEAAERPGEVIRKPRGTGKEWAAAAKAAKRKKDSPTPNPSPEGEGKFKAALDKAKAAVAALEERHARELAALGREEERLAKKRRALEARQEKEMARAVAKRGAAEAEYREAEAE